MWNNFCAVIEDLFWFALGVSTKQEIFVYGQSLPTAPYSQPLRLSETPAPVFLPVPTVVNFLPVSKMTLPAPAALVPLPEAIPEPVSAILHAPVVMYVLNPQGSACVQAPHIDFDAVIETLPYGTAVTVIGYQGRYASVNRSNITGWVAKEDLTPEKKAVWPVFVSGLTYEPDHTDTIKTRLLINDMFGAEVLGLSLQAGEYVAVRLKSEHRHIPWSRKRPRVAGAWAKLLRGTPGIHIGMTPKTDTIMEWQTPEAEGRLGYVEAVAPDLTITISAVGVEESGRYTVKTMSEEIWRELRPVFIEVV